MMTSLCESLKEVYAKKFRNYVGPILIIILVVKVTREHKLSICLVRNLSTSTKAHVWPGFKVATIRIDYKV